MRARKLSKQTGVRCLEMSVAIFPCHFASVLPELTTKSDNPLLMETEEVICINIR